MLSQIIENWIRESPIVLIMFFWWSVMGFGVFILVFFPPDLVKNYDEIEGHQTHPTGMIKEFSSAEQKFQDMGLIELEATATAEPLTAQQIQKLSEALQKHAVTAKEFCQACQLKQGINTVTENNPNIHFEYGKVYSTTSDGTWEKVDNPALPWVEVEKACVFCGALSLVMVSNHTYCRNCYTAMKNRK